MKKFKFSALICIVLVITMLIPFGSAAAKENATKPVFVAPEYKSYVAGTESNLDIELDYTPNEWLGFIVTDKSSGESYVSDPVHYNNALKSSATERVKSELSQIVLYYNYDENGNRDRLEDAGYISSANKEGKFYSYDDCVVRDQLQVFALDANGNVLSNSDDIIARIKAGEKLSEEEKAIVRGYKVIYGLGAINTELYPTAISPEDFERYVAQIVDEEGNPDVENQEHIRNKGYKLISMEVLEEDKAKVLRRAKTEDAKKLAEKTENEKIEEYILKYPKLGTEEGYEVYEIYPDMLKAKAVTDKLKGIWLQAGLTQEGLEEIYANIEFDAGTTGIIFYVPVVYLIEGNTLKAEIVTEDIDYSSEVAITKIEFLRNFAARSTGETEVGYTFVPDGSGAIIDHDISDIRAVDLQIALGDRHKDEALVRNRDKISAISYFEHSILPVFGMKQDDRAIFGIIEYGYEMANVAAAMADGSLNKFNCTYPVFFPTPMDEILYSDGAAAGVTMFPKFTVPTEVTIKTGEKKGTVEIQNWNYCWLPDTSLQVRYTFLNGEDANYSGMAAYFRQYLMDLYGLEKVEAEENTTFYADIYGAIQKKVSILGFPIERKYAVTDFEEAEIVVDALLENVDSLSIRYMGMANGSLYTSDYADHFKPILAVGGKKGYTSFLEKMGEKNVAVYPDVDPTHVYVDKSFDGFRPYYDAVKTLGKQTNIIENHNLATGLYGIVTGEEQDYFFPRWPVSAAKYEETFAGLLADLEIYGNKNISMSQLGSTLAADYDEDLIVDRTQSARLIASLIEGYEDEGYNIAVEIGNYWTLPYVDLITKIPTTSSKYIIEDYEIPFLQMVVHGLIEYTGEEINTVQDSKYQILKCLEYGCGLSARLMYEEDMILQNTYYTTVLYSMHYENWLDEIGSMYNTVNDVLKDVQDQFIVNHEKLATNVYVTTYENGLTVAVNYNNADSTVSYNGADVTIEANGFVVLEKGE